MNSSNINFGHLYGISRSKLYFQEMWFVAIIKQWILYTYIWQLVPINGLAPFSCFAHNLHNYACMNAHQIYAMVHMESI